jgi:hypothetical protein
MILSKRLLRHAVAACTVGLFGCAHQASARFCSARDDVSAQSPRTSAELAKQVTSEVFALRCLQQTSPLRLQLLPNEQFQDVRQVVEPENRADTVWPSHRAGWAGVYQPETRTISVIDSPLDDARAVSSMAFLLAHEIEHAVQHQYLAGPSSKHVDFDAALARRAVLEGEASFVAEACAVRVATRLASLHVSTDRLLEWLARREAGGASAALLREQTANLEISLNQTEVVATEFNYGDGLTFIGSLYLQGGFDAVDRALAHPPTSTEQVLHPEKYLAQEQPILIRAPSRLPAGSKTLESLTLGELGMRLALSQCTDSYHARESTDGWGGDRLTLLESDGKLRQVLWSTVWDSTEAANRFSAVLQNAPLCTCRALAKDVGAFRVAVRGRGLRVALACGPTDEDVTVAAAMLLSSADSP